MSPSKVKLGILTAIVVIGVGFFWVSSANGATTPTLNESSTYGILSSTYTDTSAATTVNGDVGFTTAPATFPAGVQTNLGSAAPYSTAGTDQGAALVALNTQGCDFSFGAAQDLSLLVQPLSPGVYCTTGAQSVGTGGIVLTSGTYIFRSTGALNTVANSVVSGGNSCDIFWTPVATTLGANSTFKGTVIDDAGITVGAVVNWVGRALSFGGTVTTDTDTITAPSCAVVPPTPDTTQNPITTTTQPTTTPEVASTTPEIPVVVATTTSTSTPTVIPLSSLPDTGYGILDVLSQSWMVIAASLAIAFVVAFVIVGVL